MTLSIQFSFPTCLPTWLMSCTTIRTMCNLSLYAPEPIKFVSTDPTAVWSSDATWEANGLPAVPESKNVIRAENNASGPQRIVVTTPNESVHQLFVGDSSTEIAVRVDGVNLSVAAGTVIEANGALELANGGTVTGEAVTIQGGAR